MLGAPPSGVSKASLASELTSGEGARSSRLTAVSSNPTIPLQEPGLHQPRGKRIRFSSRFEYAREEEGNRKECASQNEGLLGL
eukprot:scaffold15188_cov18-Tisochrysis_lutea.AAC.1